MNKDADQSPRALIAVSLAFAMGCSAPQGLEGAQDAGRAEVNAEPMEAAPQTTDGAGDAPACTVTTLPILTSDLQSFGIPVTYDGRPAALIIDTGAPNTYLWLPLDGGVESPDASGDDGGIASGDASCSVEQGCLPDAGSVTIGCETLQLDGFPQAGEPPIADRPLVGTIGDDSILAGPTWLDLVHDQLQFHAPGDPFPQAASWPATTFSRPYGYIRVEDVTLDGKATKLLLDTGSPDVLWLGEQPAAGDTEITAVDALGQPVIMYISQVTVGIGSWSKTVQVYKVPSFPYFQPLATAAGVAGLFGVSAFPDGVVFDTDARKVRVAP
jgi:hypothetical protein